VLAKYGTNRTGLPIMKQSVMGLKDAKCETRHSIDWWVGGAPSQPRHLLVSGQRFEPTAFHFICSSNRHAVSGLTLESDGHCSVDRHHADGIATVAVM
jgi:hypothetical protein